MEMKILVVLIVFFACEMADKTVKGKLSIEPAYNPFWVLEDTPFSATCVKEAATRVSLAWNINGLDEQNAAQQGYSFKKNTVRLADGRIRSSSQLTKQLTVADSDSYGPAFVVCEAVGVKNPDGDKDQIMISVHFFSVFTEHPNISKGDDVSLKCTPDYSDAKVIWSRDGQVIANSSHHLLEDQNRTLIIKSSRHQDAGVYQCIMHMRAGVDLASAKLLEQTFTKNVHVSGKPYLKKEKTYQVDGKMNGTLTLTCPVSAFPPPEVYWVRGGGSDTPVEPSSRITLSPLDGVRHASLKISGMTKEDFGLYECVAQNSVGRLVEEFKVAVAGGPSSVLAQQSLARLVLCACLAMAVAFGVLCRGF